MQEVHNKEKKVQLDTEQAILTTRITKSFEADATNALFELTARSVISPFRFCMNNEEISSYRGGGTAKLHKLISLGKNNKLTSCPRQLAKQKAVSIDQIFTRRSSDPVMTYLPDRSNIAARYEYVGENI